MTEEIKVLNLDDAKRNTNRIYHSVLSEVWSKNIQYDENVYYAGDATFILGSSVRYVVLLLTNNRYICMRFLSGQVDTKLYYEGEAPSILQTIFGSEPKIKKVWCIPRTQLTKSAIQTLDVLDGRLWNSIIINHFSTKYQDSNIRITEITIPGGSTNISIDSYVVIKTEDESKVLTILDRFKNGTLQGVHKTSKAMDDVSLLERLKSLHEAGILTDAEYESKKKEVLGRL